MDTARDKRDAAAHAPQTPARVTGQRILAWATALAILLGGLNAFVQMARLALEH